MSEERERTADLIEHASAISEQILEGEIRAQLAKAAPESDPDFDGVHCLECGEDIPAARLALKRILCVSCQTRKEARGKQFRAGLV